jgi:hypothetical protein
MIKCSYSLLVCEESFITYCFPPREVHDRREQVLKRNEIRPSDASFGLFRLL